MVSGSRAQESFLFRNNPDDCKHKASLGATSLWPTGSGMFWHVGASWPFRGAPGIARLIKMEMCLQIVHFPIPSHVMLCTASDLKSSLWKYLSDFLRSYFLSQHPSSRFASTAATACSRVRPAAPVLCPYGVWLPPQTCLKRHSFAFGNFISSLWLYESSFYNKGCVTS